MKIRVSIFFILLSKLMHSQSYLSYDTLRKNEISVSTLPILNVLSLAIPNSQSTFNFGYKHFFKNKMVLRTSFSIFIKGSEYNSNQQFYQEIDTAYIYSFYQIGGGNKTQLSLGLEKIFKINRLQHGVGFEIGLNHQFYTQSLSYTAYKKQFNGNNTTMNFYNYKNIDSLGYSNRGNRIGIATHIFYTLRYCISKHWYLSTTIGPSFNYVFYKGNYVNRETKEEYISKRQFADFPNVGFISDVSLAFRF
jgi:hypothetical protein